MTTQTEQADDRVAALVELGEVIQRVLAGTAKQRHFVDAFVCPDPTGQHVPCQPRGVTLEPILQGPVHPTPCPAAAHVLCPQHRAHQAALRDSQQAAWEQRARELGIPEKLLSASIDHPDPKAPLLVVKAWLDDGWVQRRGLGLLGENGTGKSTAAVAAMRALGGIGWFIYARDLADLLISPKHGDDALERAKQTPLLIVDNLGAEYLKIDGALVSKLDSIIWHREGNNRPLIVTSRLPWTTITPNERRRGTPERGETLRGRCTLDMIDRLETWMDMHHFRGESLRRVRS